MTDEQARICKRVVVIEKKLPELNKEIMRSKKRTEKLQLRKSKLDGELSRLRAACKHDYKKETMARGIFGTCTLCGDRRLLEEFPHPRDCDCINCDGSYAHY